jgi:periplasmic protein CpxP/Spy
MPVERCLPSNGLLITHWRSTMKRIHAVVVGVVAGVSLAVAAVTYAQPSGGMGSCPGHAMGMGPGHGPMAGVDPATMIDSHLGELKAQLKITTGQEAAWQTFTAAAKQQATSMQTMHTQMQQGTGTAPERMAQRTAAMQQRAAGMATMTNALKDLYAALTPEQQTIADQHFSMMGPGGMHFGPHSS